MPYKPTFLLRPPKTSLCLDTVAQIVLEDDEVFVVGVGEDRVAESGKEDEFELRNMQPQRAQEWV